MALPNQSVSSVEVVVEEVVDDGIRRCSIRRLFLACFFSERFIGISTGSEDSSSVPTRVIHSS